MSISWVRRTIIYNFRLKESMLQSLWRARKGFGFNSSNLTDISEMRTIHERPQWDITQKLRGNRPQGFCQSAPRRVLFSDHTNAAFSISTIFETTDVIRCSDAYTSEKLQNFCVMYRGSGSRPKTTIFGVLCGRVFVHLFPLQQSTQLISGLYFCRYMDNRTYHSSPGIDIQGQGQKSTSIETTRVYTYCCVLRLSIDGRASRFPL